MATLLSLHIPRIYGDTCLSFDYNREKNGNAYSVQPRDIHGNDLSVAHVPVR